MAHSEELPEQLFGILNSLRKYEEKSVDGQNSKYCLSDDCLGSPFLPSIPSYLRYIKEQLQYEDDLSSDIYCHLWKWKILEKDLIPIFMENRDITDENQKKFALLCVELFVMMTSPLDLKKLDFINDESEEDYDMSQFDRKMSERLKSHTDYKAVFEKNSEIFRAILGFLNTYLSEERWEMGRRSRKDDDVIRLLLSFYNNLVAIEDVPVQHVPGVVMQHQLVILYQEGNIFEALFNLISNKKELSQWNLIISEIFYHTFYNVDPLWFNQESESRAQKLLEEELNKKASNRMRNTRHNGTYWINVPGKEYTVRKRDAVRGLVTEVVDSIKKDKPTRKLQVDEYDKRRKSVRLRGPAQGCLRSVATLFLKRAFNDLIPSLMYCSDKMRGKDFIHFFYLVRFFLEFRNHLQDHESIEELTFDEFTTSQPQHNFDYVTNIISLQGFYFVFNQIVNDRNDKLWSNIHFGLECLKQMLLTLKAMKRSSNRQVRYNAEYIINKIYYNQDNLNLMILLIKDYKEQSFGYLQSLISTTHILLERLESCSKTKYEIVVNSRTSKNDLLTDDDGDQEDEGCDQTVMEFSKVERESCENHKCIFELFEKKFVNDSVISTFCNYLERYKDLDPESLDQITTMFHRISVHCSSEKVFFKMSVLELLNRILLDYRDRDKYLSDQQKNLKEFALFITEKLLEHVENNKLSFVELFLKSTHFLDQEDNSSDDNDYQEKPIKQKARSKKCVELEVIPSIHLDEKLGVAVALIFDEGKFNLLRWIQRYLEKVAEERRSFELDDDPMNVSAFGLPIEPPKLVSNYAIEPDSEELENAFENDSKFRLLLDVMCLHREDDEDRTRWFVPDSFSSDDILNLSRRIDEFMEKPFMPSEDTTLSDLIRKKRKRRMRKSRSDDAVESKSKRRKKEKNVMPDQVVNHEPDLNNESSPEEGKSSEDTNSDIESNGGSSSPVNSPSSEIDIDEEIIYKRHRSTVYKDLDNDAVEDILSNSVNDYSLENILA
ncbi:17056_t:CDS:10 [Acaulospora morrowiae]|uniref:17056_t:CDS:1 n=1 Tax=Acaulospora morrowiae TaxID=94023 RepID=A0A9N8WGP9_9GLOM|nr:17056_t:CDS:10 [Acaulospora morrowiae]